MGTLFVTRSPESLLLFHLYLYTQQDPTEERGLQWLRVGRSAYTQATEKLYSMIIDRTLVTDLASSVEAVYATSCINKCLKKIQTRDQFICKIF